MGRRLRSVVSDRPKPMAVINQKPFLDILIEYLAGFGFRRFVLCTGHKSEVIRNYYSSRNGPLKFVISEEKIPLGTAGAIKNAEEYINSNPFLVANGDSFCSVDLAKFYSLHLERQSLMSMSVIKAEDTAEFGSVAVDDSDKITDFWEKKQTQNIGYINAGIYLFTKEIFSLIPANVKYSLEYDLFPKLTDRRCHAFLARKKLIDVGTPEGLESAKIFFR